jgi:hypothetical protein
MGILDGLLGTPQAQAPGQSQRMGLGAILDPEIGLPMAAALLGNQGNMQNVGNAFGALAPAVAQKKDRNRTYDWLQKNAPEYAQLIDGGAPPSLALELYAKNRFGEKGDPYKSVGGHIFNTQDQSWMSPPDSGVAETGLNTLMMRDKNGKVIYVQPTKNGKLVQSTAPEGFEPFDPYTKAFETKSGTEAGERLGEAEGLYTSMEAKMPGLESVVVQLDGLAERATYTGAGQLLDAGRTQLGMEPRESAVARSQYIAVVDNQVLPLLRDTFGAAFTQKEGEALRSTLGAADKTPKEKQAVLKAFIEQKRRDIEALERQTGRVSTDTPVGTPQRLRFNPATGDFE